MQLRIKSFIFVCLISFVGVGFAQEEVETTPEVVSTTGLDEVYVGEIAGDEVNIRSGPGTNYYVCLQLNSTDRVKVVGSQFSWSRISPPAGSFSWISKQYVKVDANTVGVGVVTGESVRVYAGSENKKPIHSTTLQGKLNKGDKVALLGEEQDDYYKIAPPSFAYLWVSTKYVKPLGSAEEFELDVEPVKVEEVVVETIPVASNKLKEYYTLEKQLKAEKAKPVSEQNYSQIKKAFLDLAANKSADKASRYAEFTIKQIENCELALEVEKAIALQDGQLLQTKERIEKAKATKLAQIVDLGRFEAIGKFQVSSIYGTEPELKHYQLINDAGKIICFVLPAESAPNSGMDKFLGRKVGLLGTVEPHPQTAGVLVRFTEIVPLN